MTSVDDELELDKGTTVRDYGTVAFDELCKLTRQGKNICSSCNQPKEMYYGPWCPRCEVPKIKQEPTLNLLQVLRHLEARFPEAQGIHEGVWEGLVELGTIQGNDTTLGWTVNDEYMQDENAWFKRFDKYLQEVWGIDDYITFEVSW